MFDNIQPKWYIGIITLLVTLVFFIFGATPLQVHFGMWGFAATQLGILVIALTPIFLFKWKISDVMPLKKVTLKQLLALFVLLVATYMVVNVVSVITAYLFPAYTEINAYIAEFFASVPFIVAILLVGVLTGICEEALHRGLIQHTFAKHENKLAIMLIMAVIFGVFHLSPYRFLSTAIIGFMMTYIMLKTQNFLLPVIYHALQNIIAVTIGYITGAGDNVGQGVSVVISATAIGEILIITALSPLLFYAGVWLLNSSKPTRKAKYTALIFTLLLPVMGLGVLVASPTPSNMYVTNFNMTYYVNHETEPSVFDNFVIEYDGMYDLFVSISSEDGVVITSVRVEDENGDVVWDVQGGRFFVNRPTHLNAGVYKVTFTYETESIEPVLVEMHFSIRIM